MPSYISLIEEVADEVSTWAAKTVNEVTDILAPDGRAFMSRKKSIEEQLDEYLEIRGSLEGWNQWLGERELEIIQELVSGGMQEIEIALVNPRDIALALAAQYSAEMEKLLEARLAKPIAAEQYRSA